MSAVASFNPALAGRLAITKKAKSAIRQGFAWPGGYRISIICRDGCALCTDCARKEWRQIAHDTVKDWRSGWDIAGPQIIWEGDEQCAHCNASLAAYA